MKRLKKLVSPRASTDSKTPPTYRKQVTKSTLASRPPLSIRVSTSPPQKEAVDVLKDQVSTLKERISVLDTENQLEDNRLEQEFRHINEQLQEIQRGVSKVDEERHSMRSSTEILEQEKRDIQEQLFIREREVQSLVRRCQSQEEKMRESAKLRVFNSNLSTQLQDLKSTLLMKEEAISQVENLQNELKGCKEARDQLRRRLEKVSKDHDDVVDTLNTCFVNMQKMQEKQQEHDEDRKRDMKRGEVALEEQRLAYQAKITELKAESQSHKERVEQMEVVLRDNMATSTALRRERVELKKSLNMALSLKDALTLRVTALEKEKEQHLNVTQAEHNHQIQELRSALAQKDSLVETLEQEISTSMDKLMRLSEETDKLQEEKTRLECDRQKTIEKLEQEIWALKEKESARDIDMTIMSSALSTIEEEKEDLVSELNRLRDRVKELEVENAFIMDMEQQLDDVNFSLLDVQEDNDRIQATYEQALSDLQQQFDLQKDMWKEMEKGLTERVANMEIENCNLVARITNETDANRNVRASLKALESENERMKDYAKRQDDIIGGIQNQLEQQRRLAIDKDVQISQLRTHNEDVNAVAAQDREKYEKALESLKRHLDEEKNNLDEKNDELQHIKTELARVREESLLQSSKLKGQLQVQEASIASLTEMLYSERRSKIDIVKSLRDENEVARSGWRSETAELNTILLQKRSEVDSLQSKLVSLSGKGEEEQIAADRMMKIQGERLDFMQSELDELRRNLQQKTAEAERLRIELAKVQDQLQKDVASSLEGSAEQERQILSLEADLRRERSASEGKDIALQSMGYEMEAVRQDLIDKKRSLLVLQKEVENLRSVLHDDSNQRDEVLTSQVQQISLLTTELNAKRGLLDALTGQRDELDYALNAKVTEISQLRDQLASQEDRITQLDSDLTKEKKQVAHCQKRVEELEGGLEVATGELSKVFVSHASLQDDNSSLRSQIEAKDTALKSQFDKISSLEQQLDNCTAIAAQNTAALEDMKAELSTVRMSGEIDLAAAQQQIADGQSLVSSLQADLHRINLDLRKKETNILSMTAEIENARFKFDQESKAWAQQVASHEQTIARKDAELSSVKSLLEEGTAALQEELKIQTSKVCSLTKTVSQMEFEVEERDRKSRAKQAENDAKMSALLEDIQSVRKNKVAISEQYRAALKEKDENIVALNKRIEHLHQEMETRSDVSQTEQQSLRHKLQKLEIDLAISQDELRDLKMIDLKEAEETIESLESNLHAQRVKARNQEATSNSTISDLQGQLHQLQAKLSNAERGMTDTKHLNDKTISKLQGEVDALKQEIAALNAELAEKFKKLNERHTTITSLTAQKVDLELKETRLLDKIASLELDCQKAWEEHAKTSAALEREIEKHWSSRQEDGIEFQEHQSNLQKRLHEYERKNESLKKELASAETVLESRTQVLADMVAHNKEAEESRERALAELKSEKALSEEQKVKLEETQQELTRMKMNFSKVEDELVFAIQSERELRESAEVELENLLAKMKTKRDDRELTELEKENEALRDKVRRQEAFLLRKIQKDKVLRERNVKPSGIATPARTSGLRKPLSSTRKGKLTPSSSENLCDDELDELLG